MPYDLDKTAIRLYFLSKLKQSNVFKTLNIISFVSRHMICYFFFVLFGSTVNMFMYVTLGQDANGLRDLNSKECDIHN